LVKLQVYADDVNLLGQNIITMKNNAEIGLEVV